MEIETISTANFSALCIPYSVVMANISPASKLILAYMFERTGEDMDSYILSPEEAGEILNMSLETINSGIDELLEKRYLRYGRQANEFVFLNHPAYSEGSRNIVIEED